MFVCGKPLQMTACAQINLGESGNPIIVAAQGHGARRVAQVLP